MFDKFLAENSSFKIYSDNKIFFKNKFGVFSIGFVEYSKQ